MDPLTLGIILAVVVILSFGTWVVVRHDRHADAAEAGPRSLEDLKSEDVKAREEIDELMRRQRPGSFG